MPSRAQRHGDFIILFTLFVSFRLLTLVLLRYGGFFGPASDYDYYQQLAGLSDHGAYPFLSFWVEYPPVFPWLAVAAYRLALLVPGYPPVDVWFRIFLGCCLLAFEAGNLVLVYRIGWRLYGPEGALRCAWIYSGLFAPLFVWTGWFDNFPVFLALLSLDLLISRRLLLAGMAAGLGFAVKLMPALVGLTAARTLVGHAPSWARLRRIGVFVAGAAGVALACLAPFALLNWATFVASVRSWLFRAPWETFWALAEGYYSFGAVEPLTERVGRLTSVAWQRETSLTGPWPTLALALALLWLYSRRLEVEEPRNLVAFAGLSVNAFVLTGAGFSPQFVAWLMPFAVLLLPSLRGVVYATALTVVTLLLERYVYYALFPQQHWLLWAIVAIRTALVLALSAEYYSLAQPTFATAWQRIWSRALPAVAAGSLAIAFSGIALLLSQYVATGQKMDEPALVMRELDDVVPAQDALIFTDSTLYGQLYPYLVNRPAFLLSERALASVAGATPELALREIARRYPWPHLVLASGESSHLGGYVVRWLSRYGYLVRRSEFSGGQVLSYALPPGLASPAQPPERTQLVNFGNEIDLLGYTFGDEGYVARGQTIDLSLYWRATRRPGADYTLTIRLLDPSGTVLAEYERPPVGGELPTSAWVPGELVIDDQRIPVGASLPAGCYFLEVGWRGMGTSRSLAVVGADSAVSPEVAVLQPVEVVEVAGSAGVQR